MRKALDRAEAELGFLTVDLIGQLLTLAMVHWEFGAAMMVGMTNIEHRVLETALARKIVSLQREAMGRLQPSRRCGSPVFDYPHA